MVSNGPRRRPYLYRLLDHYIGDEYLQQFREDFKWIVFDHSREFQRWEPPRSELKSQARKGWIDATESNLASLVLILALASFIISWFEPLPAAQLIRFLSIVVSIIAALHKTSVDMLLYYPPYNTRDYDYLKFQSAWNRGPMNSWKASLVLILGLIMKRNSKLYEIGLWIIGDFADNS